VWLLASVLTIGLLGLTSAQAAHVHVVNNVDHGLGRGHNYDGWLIPYTQRYDLAGTISNGAVELYRSGGAGNPLTFLHGQYCSSCTIVRFNWDTNPHPDCYFVSRHRSSGPFLNEHNHYHHDGYCGG
jgi:hypothetical protein